MRRHTSSCDRDHPFFRAIKEGCSENERLKKRRGLEWPRRVVALGYVCRFYFDGDGLGFGAAASGGFGAGAVVSGFAAGAGTWAGTWAGVAAGV